MRCTYCVPSEGFHSIPHSEILSYEEILRIARLSNEVGVNKFRITGGEPLVRKGIVDFVRDINSIDGVETTFTTNGLLLNEMAQDLNDAGVKRLNISLDTLKPDRFAEITGVDLLEQVLNGIEKAYDVGFEPIKINVVAMKGINDDEISDFVNMTGDKPCHVRFIEFMPMRENGWDKSMFIPSEKLEERVGSIFDLTPDPETAPGSPSRNYLIKGYRGKVGFISPVTRHFCDSCNRIRLTSDGSIKSCLLREGEVDIKTPMRCGESDDAIRSLIEKAVMLKPSRHMLEDCNLTPFGIMTQIGG